MLTYRTPLLAHGVVAMPYNRMAISVFLRLALNKERRILGANSQAKVV